MAKRVRPQAEQYTGLNRLEPTLPSSWYLDPAQYKLELERIWYRNWIYVGRVAGLTQPGQFRTADVGDQSILMVRGGDGVLRAFHNTCRHRGSRLCTKSEGQLGALAISCEYHRWLYNLKGELVRTPNTALPADFNRKDYPLYDVALAEWRGFIFINLAGKKAEPFQAAFVADAERIANWPLDEIVVGHREVIELGCNWKVFWENFSECYHCPGVHPKLSETVPIYSRALMGRYDDPEWEKHAGDSDPLYAGGIGREAQSWTEDGQLHGVPFPGLTEEQKRQGQFFVTALPTAYFVAHADYVRSISIRPVGPEQTRLVAEWMFLPETLQKPGFEMEKVVAFARRVVQEDGYVCELAQQGMHSFRHEAGVLLPPEYWVKSFQDWVRDSLAAA